MTDANELLPLVSARLARPATTVLDGGVPVTPAGQYVVIYDDVPRLRARLVAVFAAQVITFRVVCAGRDAGETRDAVSWVLSRLAGWQPAPGDRSSGIVAPVPDGAPILPDRSVPGDVRYSQTLVFRHTSTRS